MAARKGTAWTERELKILQSHFSKAGADICKLLPARSWSAIKKQANKYGMTLDKGATHAAKGTVGAATEPNSSWTTEEDELLKANYQSLGPKECAVLLGREIQAVHTRAKRLRRTGGMGYLRPPVPKKWSAKEDSVITDYLQGRITTAERNERLPLRTKESIKHRCTAFRKQLAT